MPHLKPLCFEAARGSLRGRFFMHERHELADNGCSRYCRSTEPAAMVNWSFVGSRPSKVAGAIGDKTLVMAQGGEPEAPLVRSKLLIVNAVVAMLCLLVPGRPAQAQINYWTGKGDHFFLGACCYCVEAERHHVRNGVHHFLVDGEWKPVTADRVRLTPDPKGRKIYYCSGSLHLRSEIPRDRCGLIRGSG